MPLRIKNWDGFQHYKDRSPPWIKLHKSLLDDFDYQCLPLASKALAPMLWLLASENMDGQITDDPKRLAFRLRWSVEDVIAGLKSLIESGFIISDSNMLANRFHDDCPETETETETDISSANALEVRSDADGPAEPAIESKKSLSCPHQKVIDLYHQSLPYCPQVREWNTTRQRYLQSRWREKAVSLGWQKDAEGLEWFHRFFAFVSESKFLTGKADGRGGKPPFVADLEWLMKPSNFAKVVEGKYHQ